MNCKQARQRLAVSPREWSEIDRREVEAHLRSCSDCAALAHTYAAQEQLLSALPRAGLSLAQRQSLLDKTLVEMSRPEVSRRMPAQKFAMLWQRSRQLASGVVAFVALAALVVALIAMFSAAGQRTVASTAPTAPALSSMVTLSPTPSPAAGGSRTEVITYTVRPGDNIFSIAARFNLQAETILWANEATLASDPQRIQPGVVLTILPVDGLYYRWQAGDDLAEVAKRYNVEPDDILNWPGNHLDRQHLSIQPGTMLIIPGAVTASLAAEQACRPEAGLTSGLGKLAYIQGGDVWVKSLPDGVSQRLTTDGSDRQPRWSASGQWLSYLTYTGALWIVSADGRAARAVNAGAPVIGSWSPIVDRLAYVAEDGSLWIESADGSDRRTLISPSPDQPGGRVESLAWSPDGEWLAVARLDTLKAGQPPENTASLWRVSADGGQAIELLNAGRPSDYGLMVAGWLSDGAYILFQTDPMFSASIVADGVPLLAVAVQDGKQITLTHTVLAYPDFIVSDPAEGDRLAVIAGGYRSVWTSKTLQVLSITTGQSITLTSPEVAASSPAWSPDGQSLAYVAMPDHGDPVAGLDLPPDQMPRRLFVIDTLGAAQSQQLTDDPNYRDEWPQWSADGQEVLFVRVDESGQASLWLMPTIGGDPCRLVDALTQEPAATTYYGDYRRTAMPYYGHMDWGMLFDWQR